MEKITLIVIHPVLEDSYLTCKTGKTHSHTNPWRMFLAFFLCQGSRLEPWSMTEACVLSLAQQANKKAAPTWGACSITKLHHFCTTSLSVTEHCSPHSFWQKMFHRLFKTQHIEFTNRTLPRWGGAADGAEQKWQRQIFSFIWRCISYWRCNR